MTFNKNPNNLHQTHQITDVFCRNLLSLKSFTNQLNIPSVSQQLLILHNKLKANIKWESYPS
jgi:hypothetical protein